MPSITAKQLRGEKLPRKIRLDPKSSRVEAVKDIEYLANQLDTWKVGVFDIETSGLGADFCHVLVVGIKPLGRHKATLLRIDNYPGYKEDMANDQKIVLAAKELLSEFDVLIHFNGEGFDFPFLDTRLAVYSQTRLPLIHSIDMLPIARHKLRLNSNRLANISAALDLPYRKTSLEPQVWKRAAYGSRKDMDYIVKHCLADLKVTEALFGRLKGSVDAIFRRR